MRRSIAVVALLLLVAPEASAQMARGYPARTAPLPPEVAAQATFDTSYLLALYMAQLAAAGTPPNEADIEKAAQQYFTNGAAVTSVPTSGPGAAYFHNGAAVMAYSSSPPAPATSATVASAPEPGPQSPATSAAEPPPAPEPQGLASTAVAPGCSPLEIEAAMAFARQFASPPPPAETPPSPPTSPTPPSTAPTSPVQPRAESSQAPAVSAAIEPSCPASPSLFARFGPALGGVLFGGLAVVLWSRPRSVRVTRARNAR